MNKILQETASRSIEIARKAGASACSAKALIHRQVTISYRDHKAESLKEAARRSISLSLFVDGRRSVQSTSDLRPEALKQFIEESIVATRLLAEDPFYSLPDSKYWLDRPQDDLGLADPAYSSWTPEKRLALAKALEEATLQKGGDRTVSAGAYVQDNYRQSVLMTSNGFEGFADSTSYTAGSDLTIRDEGDRRPTDGLYRVVVRYQDLPPAESIAAETARRTLAQLGSKKIKTGSFSVIIENQMAEYLLEGLIQAMSGRYLQQKQSFLLDKRGKSIGSRFFTLIDDPLVIRGLGSRLFDGEGLPARKRIMADAGVLREYYVDWYYSRKLGREPTTAEPSNVIIPPGKRTVPEIMKDLRQGILITGLIGGNSNPTTGDSSIGISGQLFENGEPVQAVSEMNLAGNLGTFFQQLVEVANDPYLDSPYRIPSLVFHDQLISGS